jgi:hypothetical protein
MSLLLTTPLKGITLNRLTLALMPAAVLLTGYRIG